MMQKQSVNSRYHCYNVQKKRNPDYSNRNFEKTGKDLDLVDA